MKFICVGCREEFVGELKDFPDLDSIMCPGCFELGANAVLHRCGEKFFDEMMNDEIPEPTLSREKH